MIEANEEQKINAILDFQKASIERDRWARSGTIPFRSHMDSFDNDLRSYWYTISQIENIQNHTYKKKAEEKLSI